MKRTMLFFIIATIITAVLPTMVTASDLKTLTPYELSAKEIPADQTHPYGSALLTFKINNLPRSTETERFEVNIEMKIGDKDWVGVNGVPSEYFLDNYQTASGVFTFEQLYGDDTSWDGVMPISYRVLVKVYDYTWSLTGRSGYSNIATLGIKSSPWASAELQKADELGLIPHILKGTDMTKPIKREEFAAVSVKLYEYMSNKKAESVATNPFNDTQNAEVLKAYNIDLVSGVGEGRYAPKELLNREQAATMLTRVYKKIYWEGWTLKDDGTYSKHSLDYAGVVKFKDDDKISS